MEHAHGLLAFDRIGEVLARMPRQTRFPRSKRRRVRKKWAAKPENWTTPEAR